MNPKYRFLITGGSNTAITFALYALMVSRGVDYNLALAIVYVVGITLGFLANRLWTFAIDTNTSAGSAQESTTKSASTQFAKYLLVYVLIFIANLLALNLLVQGFKLNPILSQVFALGFSTVCSYFLQKSWVFK